MASDPDRLREGCVWRTEAEQANHIQTCTFYSESLGRDVTVQVRASDQAEGEPEQGIYFLDGIGSNDEYSTWSLAEAGAIDSYSAQYNLVMPAGGKGEWSTNWQEAPSTETTAPQWDTFMGEELPAYMNENFGVGTSDNAIVGVSMSGAPAVIIALNHPEVYAVARSYSGYYQTDNPIGWIAIPLIQYARADIANGISAMWGIPLLPGSTWADNDVPQRISEAGSNGQVIIVSTGNGIPSQTELDVLLAASPDLWGAAVVGIATGVALEGTALVSTLVLQAGAIASGAPVTFEYNYGLHNWYAWAANADSDAAEVEAALAAAQAKKEAESMDSASAVSSVAGFTDADEVASVNQSAEELASGAAVDEPTDEVPEGTDSDVPVEEREADGTGSGEPGDGEPSAGEPSAVEPGSGELSVVEPAVSEPSSGEPSAVESSDGEPAAVESSSGEPAAVESAVSEPSSGESAVVEAGSGELSVVEAGSGESTVGEPSDGEPSVEPNTEPKG